MEWVLHFDIAQDSLIWDGLSLFSRLPVWLLAASNPDRVQDILSKDVSHFSSRKLVLQKCAVDHIRYKNDHWNGFYHILFSTPGESTPQTTDLEGEIYPPGRISSGTSLEQADLSSEGWQMVIPDLNLKLKKKEAEKVLVTLEFLTDPEQSRQYLMRTIRSSSPHYQALDIKTCRPNIVRYKPGSRCTIVYKLEYAHDSLMDQPGPERVVAKTYRGVKGKNAYHSMTALWNSPLRIGGAVQIAEPLAYDEQQRVLIQAAIPEEKTLKSLFQSALQDQTPEIMAELKHFMQKTAVGLAALHHSGVTQGEAWVLEDEMAEIRERVDSLSAANPALANAAEPLLNRLSQIAAAVPADPMVPSHGSFRPSQVLIHQDAIGFIDFDSFCQSEPANDVALFLSTLMVNSLVGFDSDEEEGEGAAVQIAGQDAKARPAQTRAARFALAASLCEEFLTSYEQQRPISRQRVALWESLDLLLLVLHYWIKVKPEALKEIFRLLEDFLQTMHFVRKS